MDLDRREMGVIKRGRGMGSQNQDKLCEKKSIINEREKLNQKEKSFCVGLQSLGK